ncbi:TIGR03084 family metal-binding protein [Nocardioides sp.]|uniref:TIGR03084 family metal-binding protein n=1 Tax=Nocardioides sp. TaxID=35761 RepID=UPI002B278D43|nr:TIGR03084 family metal-binding protein [Nocardioides sp.]
MSLIDDLLHDLTLEGDALRAVVAALPDEQWATDTPAEGWTIATTIAHLLWTDEAAVLAARAHEDKAAWDELVLAGMADPTGFVDTAALEIGQLPPADLLARWDDARPALADALRAVPDGQKMPWFGPPMSATSMVTARYMETWAHSLDIYDALGREPERTDRIKHVAHIGVRTRGFSFANAGQEVPAAEVRVELIAPSGEVWTWGPDDAAESLRGSAYDFCLLATQRVHRADTDLVAEGPGADAWLDVAQCFAGPAGGGREQKEAHGG